MDDGRARMLELFDGRRLTVRLPELPNPGTRRLLAFLGVEVEIVTTQSVTRCPHFPRCSWNFVGPESRGDELAVVHVNLMHAGDFGSNGHLDPDAGRTALDAMDRGEPQRDLTALLETRDCLAPSCDREAENGSEYCRVCEPDGSDSQPSVEGPTTEEEVETMPVHRTWTREEIVEAIRAYHAEHGRPPTGTEWGKAGDHPSTTSVKKLWGSWGDAIVAAGFDRPTRGGSRPGHKHAAAADPGTSTRRQQTRAQARGSRRRSLA